MIDGRKGRHLPPSGLRQAWGPPAALSRRAVAHLIDLVLVTMLGVVVLGLVAPSTIEAPSRGQTDQTMVRLALLTATSALYFVLAWRGWRATPGQALVYCSVSGPPYGLTLSWGSALLRWLLVTLGPLPTAWLVTSPSHAMGRAAVFVYVAWGLFLLWTASRDPMRRGLHDRWSRSVIQLTTGGVLQPTPRGALADPVRTTLVGDALDDPGLFGVGAAGGDLGVGDFGGVDFGG